MTYTRLFSFHARQYSPIAFTLGRFSYGPSWRPGLVHAPSVVRAISSAFHSIGYDPDARPPTGSVVVFPLSGMMPHAIYIYIYISTASCAPPGSSAPSPIVFDIHPTPLPVYTSAYHAHCSPTQSWAKATSDGGIGGAVGGSCSSNLPGCAASSLLRHARFRYGRVS